MRLRLRAADLPEVGSRISVFARLLPPGGPAAPGAYDFQRHAWFARIGAVGYAFGLSRQLKPMASDSKESWTVWIATLRQQLAQRIRTAIPGTSGAVAAALNTGDRSAIPKELVEAMRDSGLAHLLAISGLHMGLVAATLFFGLRAFLAMSELLALRYPIKKWAAAVALAGVRLSAAHGRNYPDEERFSDGWSGPSRRFAGSNGDFAPPGRVGCRGNPADHAGKPPQCQFPNVLRCCGGPRRRL